MGILSRWRLVLQRWSSQSRKFVVFFYIRRQITITPGCGRQYGCSRTKDSIYRNTARDSGKSARWLAGEESGRKAMRWAVENVRSSFFVIKKIQRMIDQGSTRRVGKIRPAEQGMDWKEGRWLWRWEIEDRRYLWACQWGKNTVRGEYDIYLYVAF